MHLSTKTLASALAIGFIAAPAANAASTAIYFSGTNLGLGFPDDDPVGISSTITATSGATLGDDVPAAGGFVESVELAMNISHSWVGDLIMELTSPEGTTITLMDRAGDFGDGGFGDSSDLAPGTYLYFTDRSPISSEEAGAECAGDEVIGVSCGNIFAPLDMTTAFAGENLLGDWTLSISDNAGGDIGGLGAWYIEIDYTPVPLPSSVWMLTAALAGLGFSRRGQSVVRG